MYLHRKVKVVLTYSRQTPSGRLFLFANSKNRIRDLVPEERLTPLLGRRSWEKLALSTGTLARWIAGIRQIEPWTEWCFNARCVVPVSAIARMVARFAK
jgi:hypothetical protein